MYRTGDPRFRRRLDELGQSLESAGATTKGQLYDFQQLYIKPCLGSITQGFTSCLAASCPGLKITANQRDRYRRQREYGRRGSRLDFDFYDDWDEEENDEFDRLLARDAGYGTITHAQPGRRRGMSYPKGRRKSAVDVGVPDPTVIPGSSMFGKLFGGKALRYKPSAADLQDHPGTRISTTEGEALLRDGGERRGGKHRRVRSHTATSGHTTDSLSSRGDIFPSDEELDDAIPLDDEFAMVLERRTTLSGPETESSSNRTRSTRDRGQDDSKRPSAGSRRSTHSSPRKSRSSTFSSTAHTPTGDAPNYEDQIPAINELKQEEHELAEQEEAEIERKRQDAQRLAAERGLAIDDGSSKEATPEVRTPILEPVQRYDEPSAMTTPLGTDDEVDGETGMDGNNVKS